MKQFKHLKSVMLTLLLLSLAIPENSNAGEPQPNDGLDKLIVLTALATPFITPHIPKLFIENNYEYDYWTSFSYGIGSAILMGVTADKFSTKHTGEAFFSGLLIGNYIGYITSKQLKENNISLTILLNRQAQGVGFTYQF